MTQHSRFRLEGMTCASCVARAERVLQAVPRVSHAAVALAARAGESGVAGLLVGAFGEGVALLPADREGRPWNPEQPGGPALFYGIGPLFLDYGQARALQAELQALFGRYGQQAGPARYLYQVIFTPDSRG